MLLVSYWCYWLATETLLPLLREYWCYWEVSGVTGNSPAATAMNEKLPHKYCSYWLVTGVTGQLVIGYWLVTGLTGQLLVLLRGQWCYWEVLEND